MNYANFEDLSREHEAFQAFLAREEERLTPSGALPVLAILLEQIHHAKEEQLLFPVLFGSETLNVGGPKCMTFFTPRVLGGTGWADSFQELKKTLGPDKASDSRLSPFRREAFAANSMIKIPLEDHILGARALAELLQNRDPAHYRELFPKFAALLRDHIQREEECLFEVFRRSLTSEQKQIYALSAAAFDVEHKTAALLEQLALS